MKIVMPKSIDFNYMLQYCNI